MSLGSYLNLLTNPVSQIRFFLTRAEAREDQERHLDAQELSSLRAEDESFTIINEREASQADQTTNEPHQFPLGLSTLKVQYLKDTPAAASRVIQQLEHEGFTCKFDFEARKIDIRTMEGKKEEQALKLIEESIFEIELPTAEMPMMDIIDDDIGALPTQDSDIEALVVKGDGVVKIVGIADALKTINRSLRRTVEGGAAGGEGDMPIEDTKVEVLGITECCCTYLYTYKWAIIETFVNNFADVKLIPGKNKITLRGPTSGVNEVARMIRVKIEAVKVFTINLDSGMNVATIADAADRLGKKYQCSITFQQSFGDVEATAPPEPATLGSQLQTLTLTVTGHKETGVKVAMNSLENQKAHVIVNTTNNELELGRGRGVSWCILQAAGQSIQTEVRQKYPNGIQHGEVAESGPGDMKTCRTIYHGALPEFPKKGSKDYQKLEDECFTWMVSLVFNSLIKASASEQGFRTVAFPALGTGFLEYPVQHVVQLMYKAVRLYNDDKRSGPIKRVIIVIYPDTKLEVKQLFLAHRHTHKMKTRHVRAIDQIHTEMRKERHRRQNCEIRVSINNILLQVVHGNTREACDVTEAVLVLWSDEEILNPETNPGLRCTDPEKSNWRCASYVYELPESKCAADSTNLPSRTIMHSYCKDNSERAVIDAIVKGLKSAAKINCNTITIPIASDGHMGKTPQASAQMIVSAMKKAKTKIYVVTVAIPDDDIFVPFATKVASLLNDKLLEPADVDKSPVAVDLWEKTFAQQAFETTTALEAVVAKCNKDSVLLIASESDEKNKTVAEEIKACLASKLSVNVQ